MQNLPTELVHDILASCPSGRALLSLSSTCHRFRSIYLQDCSELLYASIINDPDLELLLHLVGTIQICASNPKLVELRKLHRPCLVLSARSVEAVKYVVRLQCRVERFVDVVQENSDQILSALATRPSLLLISSGIRTTCLYILSRKCVSARQQEWDPQRPSQVYQGYREWNDLTDCIVGPLVRFASGTALRFALRRVERDGMQQTELSAGLSMATEAIERIGVFDGELTFEEGERSAVKF